MDKEQSLDRPVAWNAELECAALHCSGELEAPHWPQAEAISVASVWRMDSPATANEALAGRDAAFIYRRDGHPNERSLSAKLAGLHNAGFAMVTAQGMSAIAALGLSILKPGEQVWVADELYGKSTQLFSEYLVRWGIEHHAFDPTCSKQVMQLAQSRARLVFVETISNPRVRLPDLKSLANAAHQAGGLLAVDNTFATHLLCRPLDFDADLVVESLSKQVNGHSDAMLGLVAAKDPQVGKSIENAVSAFGMASSPLDCYLTHRGLATLAVRLERACGNAMALAACLRELPQVQKVDYPGLETHPQHALASRQLQGGFGWMLSFQLVDRPASRGSWEGVEKLFRSLQPDIPFLPSLGDVCTSVSHPLSTSHRGLTPAQRELLGITDGTVRISCGIEPTNWLVERFTEAIAQSIG